MKKFMCIILAAVMALSVFTACGAPADDGVTRVAIVQQLDHASLDEIRAAIEAELTAASIEFEVFNGQNDATVLNQIGAQVVSDNFDAIVPIATLAAQCMVTAADGYNIPIIYAACSDPESAGLTGMDTVTGTSDALNTRFIIDMMLAADPDISCVGLLILNSLLVLPGAASRNVAKNLKQYHLFSVLFALVSGITGLTVSYFWGCSAGAAISLCLALIFALTFAFRKVGN